MVWSMNMNEPVCLWDVGATLGEGALWHAPGNSVYFVDIKERRIYCCAADGSDRRSWPAPQQIGFIVPLESGGFPFGVQGGLYRFFAKDGRVTPIPQGGGDVPTQRTNKGDFLPPRPPPVFPL